MQKKPTSHHLRFEAKARASLLAYFHRQGFLQVHTPILSGYTSCEKHLYPFVASLETPEGKASQALFLRFSSELALKKILAKGIPKAVEIGWVFRNREGQDGIRHFAQFCMVEWNETKTNFNAFIDNTKAMLACVAKEITGKSCFIYNGKNVALQKQHWHTLTVEQAFLKYADIDFSALERWDDLLFLAMRAGAKNLESFDDAFTWFLLEKIEPRLAQLGAVVLKNYPQPAAAFARLDEKERTGKKGKLRLARRFEIYIAGIELANGFDELNNGPAQRQRMRENMAWLQKNQVQNGGIDEDFIHAVNAMPDGCGAAMGFERLVMLLAGENTLKACFPWR